MLYEYDIIYNLYFLNKLKDDSGNNTSTWFFYCEYLFSNESGHLHSKRRSGKPSILHDEYLVSQLKAWNLSNDKWRSGYLYSKEVNNVDTYNVSGRSWVGGVQAALNFRETKKWVMKHKLDGETNVRVWNQ